MKTRDAFALRGFDEQRFLSERLAACGLSARALFKPDGDADDFDDLLRTRRAYLKFCDELFHFRQRLIRHIDRLGRYTAKTILKPKSKRAVALSARYADIAKTIQGAETTAISIRSLIDTMQRACCLKVFASRLRETRRLLGLTQRAFGEIFGLSQRGYSDYEQALREPSTSMLKILARVSNRPVGWFLDE